MLHIFYPLSPTPAAHNYLELKYSLRSLHKHLKEPFKVIILGAPVPDWLSDEAEVVEADSYLEAYSVAASYPGTGRLLWMNDDIFLLQDTTWEGIYETTRSTGVIRDHKASIMLDSNNLWVRRKGQVALHLAMLGYEPEDYGTHAPYAYEAPQLRKILSEYSLYGHKASIENAYFSTYEPPNKYNSSKGVIFSPAKENVLLDINVDSYDYLNITAQGLHASTVGVLNRLYPNPSPFEKNA